MGGVCPSTEPRGGHAAWMERVAQMRLLAFIATLAGLAAAALAGQGLWQAVSEAGQELPAPAPAPLAPATAPEPQPPKPPMIWPALFGELAPPAAPEPPEVDPQPPEPEPQPPGPPLDSLGYRLKGVIRADSLVWALVSHPTGEQVVRVGDSLAEGLVVARIDKDGLWIDTGRDTPELLAFED